MIDRTVGILELAEAEKPAGPEGPALQLKNRRGLKALP
jgi:hypothetical protein